MTIYGAHVNRKGTGSKRKWTESESEVECDRSTSVERLRPTIFKSISSWPIILPNDKIIGQVEIDSLNFANIAYIDWILMLFVHTNVKTSI